MGLQLFEIAWRDGTAVACFEQYFKALYLRFSKRIMFAQSVLGLAFIAISGPESRFLHILEFSHPIKIDIKRLY